MVNPVLGVEEQGYVLSQDSYDVFEAFASIDSCAFTELSIEGGNPEWHKSTERVGNASLQTEIQGKRSGTWNGSVYAKPNAFGSLPDAHEMIRAGMGRQQVVLTVVDYTAATTDSVTLILGGSATAVLVEGTDFNASTSNNLTASNLAAAINNDTDCNDAGVTATVSGAVVTVSIVTDWMTIASTDTAAIAVTSVRFALSSSGVPAGLQIMKYAGRSFCEIISGAWVETIEIESEGNAEGMWNFSGGFARKAYLYGEPQTDGTLHSSSAVTINLATGDDGKISAGMWVQFRRTTDGALEDNSGSGYEVVAVDHTAGTITIEAGGLAGALSAVPWDIEPWAPTFSISGTILGGIANGFSIAGTALGMNSTKITVQTGVRASDKEATTDRPSRLARGKPADRVMGETEFYFLDENTAQVGLGWNGTTQAVVLRQGPDVSGQRSTLSMGATRCEIPSIETPEDEEATHVASLIPRQVSAPDDELVWTLD